jgi:hypothetical protein
MSDVRVLIAAQTFGSSAVGGDIIEVVRDGFDWGNLTVAPNWIRMTIVNVPGTQEESENLVAEWLGNFRDAFVYEEFEPGQYRLSAHPSLAANFRRDGLDLIRDQVLAVYNGTLIDQRPTSLEFSAEPRQEVSLMRDIVASQSFRRFRLSESMLTAALKNAEVNLPIYFSRPWNQVSSNVVDKLRA